MDQETLDTDASREDRPLIMSRDNRGMVTLTLNRPRQYNALSHRLMAELEKALGDIGEDRGARLVVIQGAGRGFCAGHDLKEMRAGVRAFVEDAFGLCGRVMQALQAIPQPTIAKVHGTATAAGCQLVATCDLAIASEEARFGTPGVNIGLFCSTPMVALTRNLSRKRSMELLLLGETIDAERALDWGLINWAVPAEALERKLEQVSEALLGKSAETLAIGKEAFYRQISLQTAEAYAYAGAVMTRNMMTADAAEGIDAFLEKRAPQWTHGL